MLQEKQIDMLQEKQIDMLQEKQIATLAKDRRAWRKLVVACAAAER